MGFTPRVNVHRIADLQLSNIYWCKLLENVYIMLLLQLWSLNDFLEVVLDISEQIANVFAII